jgi:hypothetical protein
MGKLPKGYTAPQKDIGRISQIRLQFQGPAIGSGWHTDCKPLDRSMTTAAPSAC